MASNHLQSLVVGRFNEFPAQRVILCYHHIRIPAKQGSLHLETIEQLVANDAFVRNKSYMITDDDSSMVIYYSRDDVFLYFAVTDRQFPAQLATSLFTEMKKTFASRFNPIAIRGLAKNGLMREGQPLLEEMAVAYCDGSADRMMKVTRQVEETKQKMDENVLKILDRQEKLESLEEKSNDLAGSASDFAKKSKGIKSTMRSKWIKLIIIGIVIVLILIVVIVLIVVLTTTSKNK
ncbi:vesicle-associated membrane protein 7C [Monocercomonoides exilis]|uniref:vesicle-associated membrane protein 7C n=1 Tax=Monocercomonoides exilis TaxID=2049356 RepID=UPI00355A2993|nr:vesicle-associated membrane protein 7C [Monocercomonoides exilis]|eukprot:MONOS_5707.1-p1 / transcript=MONOS_5707.1 / gene=MONOS_5707 / organism=Monocercomonoides_exilis_PA203 / gene_product= vesicle-associated membrane protein 7C / transcript_product= vesicle-associated membrane protein 7C / location=Mono_scaffold00169:94749-95727(+) / protein_length=235 / sequence_SO=supercontig / SO=protein_coding / is_pseudo=false